MATDEQRRFAWEVWTVAGEHLQDHPTEQSAIEDARGVTAFRGESTEVYRSEFTERGQVRVLVYQHRGPGWQGE